MPACSNFLKIFLSHEVKDNYIHVPRVNEVYFFPRVMLVCLVILGFPVFRVDRYFKILINTPASQKRRLNFKYILDLIWCWVHWVHFLLALTYIPCMKYTSIIPVYENNVHTTLYPPKHLFRSHNRPRGVRKHILIFFNSFTWFSAVRRNEKMEYF